MLAFFWQWFPRVAERDPQTGETLLVERNRQPDTPLLIGDLRERLTAGPGATAEAYFKEHGMSCRPEDGLIRCEYAMAASFVCLLVRVSGDNVVKSAFAMLEVTCPPKW